MTGEPSALPYGPATRIIRAFLVQLAALDRDPHDAIVIAYAAACQTARFDAADQLLSETIARSGRTDARDALFGPFVQLMRERHVGDATQQTQGKGSETMATSTGEEIELDPIAESALAALMSLLVHDLLPSDALATLYAPYEPFIPLATILR